MKYVVLDTNCVVQSIRIAVGIVWYGIISCVVAICCV